LHRVGSEAQSGGGSGVHGCPEGGGGGSDPPDPPPPLFFFLWNLCKPEIPDETRLSVTTELRAKVVRVVARLSVTTGLLAEDP
jgi:hypothetical protein